MWLALKDNSANTPCPTVSQVSDEMLSFRDQRSEIFSAVGRLCYTYGYNSPRNLDFLRAGSNLTDCLDESGQHEEPRC